MGRFKKSLELFDPFRISSRESTLPGSYRHDQRDSWETSSAPPTVAPKYQFTDIDINSNSPPAPRTKFAHSPALKALEGQRTGSSTIRSVSPVSALFSGISPSDGFIGIGVSPSAERDKQTSATTLQKSYWSPDTPITTHSLAPSSIYSQVTEYPNRVNKFSTAPPVPSLPAVRTGTGTGTNTGTSKDRSPAENDSPFTLFSEDEDFDHLSAASAASERKGPPNKDRVAAGTGQYQSRDWWAITDPNGVPVNSNSKPPESQDEWWKHIDEKRPPPLANRTAAGSLNVQSTPIIRVPTPRRAESPASSMSGSIHATTPRALRPEKLSELWEDPPPYSAGGESRSHSHDNPKFAGILQLPGAASRPRPARYPQPISPGPISPAFARSLAAASGGIGMATMDTSGSNMPVPLVGAVLPDRDIGTFIPAEHAIPSSDKAERTRRRHEKEDYWAHRFGDAWANRGPFHTKGYFGVPGAKGRKRRRWCCCLIIIVIVAIVLGSSLAVYFAKRNSTSATPPTRPTRPTRPIQHDPNGPVPTQTSSSATSTTTNMFATASGFPPIPTGVLTVVGPVNPVNDDSCVDPATLWSCSLPKEDHESVGLFPANRPAFIMHIQWDTSEENNWDVSNGVPPTFAPVEVDDSGQTKKVSNKLSGKAPRNLQDRALGFKPSPAPPSFEEMWFLGNTTDRNNGDELAGEPTPFYMTMLDSIDAPVGPNAHNQRRQSSTPSPTLPPPELNDDETGAAAVLVPLPKQQPLRLYDRGLPTEHYAFYTHFKRTIYVRSVTPVNGTKAILAALDKDGGSRQRDADFLVTWGSVRYRMQLFTRDASKQLVDDEGSIDGSAALTMPGTMPLPMIISLDLHGGVASSKFVWHHDIDDDGTIDTSNPGLVDINMGSGVVNAAHDRPNPNFGGVDGGVGGCGCRWTNFLDDEVATQLSNRRLGDEQ